VRELGKKFNELVEINLEMNPEYGEVFRPNLDPNRILRELRLMTGKRLFQAPRCCSLTRFNNSRWRSVR